MAADFKIQILVSDPVEGAKRKEWIEINLRLAKTFQRPNTFATNDFHCRTNHKQ